MHVPTLFDSCHLDINIEGIRPTVTVGQGEYIVFRQNSLGEAEQITKDLYLRVYSVFNRYSAMELMETRPDDVFIRDTLIAAEIKKIDPALEAVFIPRTLYELFYIFKSIREDQDKNKICIRQNKHHHELKKKIKTHEAELGLSNLAAPCSSSDTTASSKSSIESLRNRFARISTIFEEKDPKHTNYDFRSHRIDEHYHPVFVLNEKSECWHMKPFQGKSDKKNNMHPRVMDIAYRLNGVIIKSMRPVPGGFTISELLAHAIKIPAFLKNSYDAKFLTKIDRPGGVADGILIRFHWLDDGYSDADSFAVTSLKHVKTIIRAVELDCSPLAKDHVLIYRGGDLSKDSIKEGLGKTHNHSFGCGLFSGAAYDHSGSAWYFMRRERNDAYAIPIHFNFLRRSPFWIPATNTLVQLFSNGEVFHPRTLIPSDLVIKYAQFQFSPKGFDAFSLVRDPLARNLKDGKTFCDETFSKYLEFLRTPLTRLELSFLFDCYKSRAIILKPHYNIFTRLKLEYEKVKYT